MALAFQSLWTLGEFVFSINTLAPDTTGITNSWRWKKQARIGAIPQQQFLGNDTAKRTLRGVQFPHLRNANQRLSRELNQSLTDVF